MLSPPHSHNSEVENAILINRPKISDSVRYPMILTSPKEHLANFLQRLPFPAAELPAATCLVGGAVRDALLQRDRDYLDFDFVLPDAAVETARDIANRYKMGFVVLDEARQIARVVFPQGTLDFALQEGDHLGQDLQRRDYCINAIAYHINSDTIIDPLNGLEDLEAGVLRMVAPENLVADPLRLLRAYRQAAQLGFNLEPHTHTQIRRQAPLLQTIAAERVQHELHYLLSHPGGDRWLQLAFEDGLVEQWLPATESINLQKIRSLGNHCADLSHKFPQFSREPQWLMFAKLICLVGTDPQIAPAAIARLKYSRQELRLVTTAVEQLPLLLSTAQTPLTLRQQYFFFLAVKNVMPILTLVAMAYGVKQAVLISLLARYFNPRDPVAHPRPLLTGRDLISALSLSPGPQIGTLLTELQLAQISGTVSTKSEAIAWGKAYLAEQG